MNGLITQIADKPQQVAAEGEGGRPVLYCRPVAVSTDRFASIKIGKVNDFSFAAETDSLPLAVGEFAKACRSLPIVFSADRTSLPVAVVGLDGRNGLIGTTGGWAASAYMPDYVRRYPFILAQDAGSGAYTLCIDEAFTGLGAAEGEPLFVGGHPSTFTATAAEYCRQYQARHRHTEEFVAALEGLDLLRPSQVTLRQADGSRKAVGGFKVVDQERWAALGDAGVLSLRKAGWLEPVICHMISLENWAELANGAHRGAAAEPAEKGEAR